MKTTKKVLATLFIIIFTLGFVGCGISSEKNDESKTNNTAVSTFPQFNSKDTDNNPISSDVFKDKKLTLVNIWGTFCGPCLEELPHLQEIQNEMKDKGVNVVGIIADGEESELDASDILKKDKIVFRNVIPNNEIKENLLVNFNAVPVSMLVDSNGKIVGDIIVGARTKEQYKTIIEDALSKLK